MDRKKQIFWTGVALVALGFVFQIGETWHFGWNLRAESMEEAICDLAAAVIRYAGFMAIVYAACIMPSEMRHTFVMDRGDKNERA